MRLLSSCIAALVITLACAGSAHALDAMVDHVILPQRRVMHPWPQHESIVLQGVDARIAIREGVARTELDIRLMNPAARAQEAELVVPVPDGCSVVGLEFDGQGLEPTAKILPREEAKRIYRDIVAHLRDPALMEFAGYNLVRSSVFPVPPGGTQRLRLIYEQILPREGGRVDYVLPRSAQLGDAVPWTITVAIDDQRGVGSLYSPSHRLAIDAKAGGRWRAHLAPGTEREAGAFRLSYLISPAGGDGVAASIIAYPDPVAGGGYFLLMAGAPPAVPDAKRPPQLRREVTVVIDRSGSMHGEKMEQAREAALQIVAGLDQGEAFNAIVYNHGVEVFSPQPLAKNPANERALRDWLQAVNARGGTNIHDALIEALRQPTTPGALPIVLFLTDGIATVGKTLERDLRDIAVAANVQHRRIFTVGIGSEINSHLLEKIADDSRATSTFIAPGQNIETAIATTFDRLRGPVLADLELATLDDHGAPRPGRTIDVSPSPIGDLFQGEQLIVVGRYVGEQPTTFAITGRSGAESRRIVVPFDPARASTANAFVPRLWASRKIAALIDAIRSLGMDDEQATHAHDPRYRELVDEVVRLSTEFGVLTEYTAFLAREPNALPIDHDLWRERQRHPPGDPIGAASPAPAMKSVREAADAAFKARAFGERSGAGSLAQSENAASRKQQTTANLGNRYLDQDRREVESQSCQPVASGAYYNWGGTWIRGSLVADGRATRAAARTIAFASPEYFQLAEQLAATSSQGALALDGDILLEVGGETVRVSAAF